MAQAPSTTEKVSSDKTQTRAEEGESKLPVFGQRSPDALERAIIEGRVTDSDGKPISAESAKPVIPHILDEGEQKSLKGELKTGDIGFLPLDEKGAPAGPATKYPPRDRPAAPVATVVPAAPTILATPAGAFLTDATMQPSPHTNKYSSPSYKRDYAKIAEHVAKRDGDLFGDQLK